MVSRRFVLAALLVLTGIAAVHAVIEISDNVQTCSGCSCDCGWATAAACGGSGDGSCCYDCCCKHGSGGSPASPPSPPAGGSHSGGGAHGKFCPSANDLTVAYGSPQITNQGWSISAGGGVATKASFNLLGGKVEYDVDFSNVRVGVNANIYSISPVSFPSSGFSLAQYCDGQAMNGQPFCVEVDWIESNGNCAAATTLHTNMNPAGGCNKGGCQSVYKYSNNGSFHMVVSFDASGHWTTQWGGNTIGPNSLNPQPDAQAWSDLANAYRSHGAVIYSSQWTGWVPMESCGPTSGDLGSSHFSIRNLQITGTVVQGPTPTSC